MGISKNMNMIKYIIICMLVLMIVIASYTRLYILLKKEIKTQSRIGFSMSNKINKASVMSRRSIEIKKTTCTP